MSELPRSTDLVVVGGGITGCATAAAAAARGLDVVVVEKEEGVGREASGRAQGVIRIQGRDEAEIPIAQEARKHWHAIEDEAGIELVFGGNLYLCATAAERAEVERLAGRAHAAGMGEVRLLEPDQARAIVPAATGPFLAAMWSPHDGHAQPLAASRYFARLAERRGARFVFGTRALRLEVAGDRVRGLVTDRGTVTCGAVAVCGGVWTPHLLATAGVDVPVMPVALSEGETSPLPPLFSAAVRAVGFGGRQRPDGRIVFSAGLGATVRHGVSFYDLRHARLWLARYAAHRAAVRLRFDWAAVRRQLRHRSAISPATIPVGAAPLPDHAAIAVAHKAMARMIPAVAAAEVRRVWAGWIDMSPDGLPIIDAGPDGLAYATGLSGHGFALGPVIGEILADLITEKTTSRPVAAFRAERFRASVPIPQRVL